MTKRRIAALACSFRHRPSGNGIGPPMAIGADQAGNGQGGKTPKSPYPAVLFRALAENRARARAVCEGQARLAANLLRENPLEARRSRRDCARQPISLRWLPQFEQASGCHIGSILSPVFREHPRELLNAVRVCKDSASWRCGRISQCVAGTCWAWSAAARFHPRKLLAVWRHLAFRSIAVVVSHENSNASSALVLALTARLDRQPKSANRFCDR